MDDENRIINLLEAVLDNFRTLGREVNELRTDVVVFHGEFTEFRSEVQDEFSIVKARLRRIEGKVDDHEARITALEKSS